MKLFIPLLLLFSLQETVFSQEQIEPTNEKTFKHAIGGAVGYTTGYGVSYRFLPGKFGVQATFSPYKNSYDNGYNNNTSSTSRYSTGVTFLFKVIEEEFASLFIYQGNHYYYAKEVRGYNTYPWPNPGPIYVENTTTTEYWNNGIGFGIELIALKRISFNIMVGYASYENYDKISTTGESGLYFKF